LGYKVPCLFVLATTCVVCPGNCQQPYLASTSEAVLRASALKIVRPAYPLGAVQSRQTGVAVAQIYVDDRGLVGKVEVLEAPSPSIAESVREALGRWKFEPEMDGRGVEVRGKITYYFVISKDKSAVLEPKDAPYVGRWR
jgi:TonB family protein